MIDCNAMQLAHGSGGFCHDLAVDRSPSWKRETTIGAEMVREPCALRIGPDPPQPADSSRRCTRYLRAPIMISASASSTSRM